MNPPLLLGSASQRRSKILEEMGLEFVTAVADVEEVFYPDDPERTAVENAGHKHAWCAERYPDHAIIAADTVLDFDGRCMTKPSSMQEAVAFLKMLSARTHTVITGVALSRPGQQPDVVNVKSSVTFRALDEAVISDYFSKFSPLDRAGAYDIDEHGDMIIESFSGSYTNIMGLPKETIEKWLRGGAQRLR